MGLQTVSRVKSQTQVQQFVRALLKDVAALEYLLKHDWFENNITRIGAEQEIFLVDKHSLKPSPINMQILQILKEKPWLKTELGKFNLETNLNPLELKGNSLSEMVRESHDYLATIRAVAHSLGAEVVLTGILPTLHRYDVDLHNLTNNKRYRGILENTQNQIPDRKFKFHMEGIDELVFHSRSSLLPACNTSFQLHLQVASDEFAKYYNIAQALAGPVLATAANSPLVFGKRLWHESRMKFYQQASDTSLTCEYLKERRPRVIFGNDWVQHSVLDIFKEDIARFKVMITGDIVENPFEKIQQGITPQLKALQIYNSTVYRWNRPCYGISPNGKPHLRIENRMLPAGPTVEDEMANAALWWGTMIGLAEEVEDVRKRISFVEVKENFGKAAKYGIESELSWLDGQKIAATDLLLHKLIPLARKGLKSRGVDSSDIDLYLGIIEKRTQQKTSGASWILSAYNNLLKKNPPQKALTVLTANIIKNQWKKRAVHTWEMPKSANLEGYFPIGLKVEEVMQTDLQTIGVEDVAELAVNVMKWQKLNFLAAEDAEGDFVGLVVSYLLPSPETLANSVEKDKWITVGDIMLTKIQVIEPEMDLQQAFELMGSQSIACLPVVKEGKLLGVLTENEVTHIRQHLMMDCRKTK